MTIPIRRATPSDAEQIAALLLAAFRESEPRYTPAAFQATTPDSADLVRRLGEGPTWAAIDGDAIAGTVSALDRGDEVHLRSMAVHPALRGRGIASQLLVVVHAYAVSRGARRLTLTTTPFLTDAIRLYERHGFQRIPGDLDLHGTPLFAMAKDLGVATRTHPASIAMRT